MIDKERLVEALMTKLSETITTRNKFDLPDYSIKSYPNDSGNSIIVCVATEQFTETPTLKWFKLTIEEV